MILLTRPEQRLAKSLQVFRMAGIAVTGFAPFTILRDERAVTDCIKTLLNNELKRVIVTSQFAVTAMTSGLSGRSELQWFAVGSATAAALAAHGIKAITPLQQTSEGLLILPALMDAKPPVIIIKGEGGRTTLRETLSARGCAVTEFAVYRRSILENPVTTDDWVWTQLTGIVTTSGEMTDQLFRVYDKQQLRSQRWLTVSERIAEHLKGLGVEKVAVCNDASDNALTAWIKENWE